MMRWAWSYLMGDTVCEHRRETAECVPCAVTADRRRAIAIVDELMGNMYQHGRLAVLRVAIGEGWPVETAVARKDDHV